MDRHAELTHIRGVPFHVGGFSRLWLVAAATYRVGDVMTTIAIIYFTPAMAVANPAIYLALQTFGGGFLDLKLLALYACLGISLWGGVLAEDPVLF